MKLQYRIAINANSFPLNIRVQIAQNLTEYCGDNTFHSYLVRTTPHNGENNGTIIVLMCANSGSK